MYQSQGIKEFCKETFDREKVEGQGPDQNTRVGYVMDQNNILIYKLMWVLLGCLF